MFDDTFETVYSAGLPTAEVNTICDKLFEKSRELYAEEEFDDDGELIYRPPPLDDVWLDVDERRDRRTALADQRHRTAEREKATRRARAQKIENEDDGDDSAHEGDDTKQDFLDSEGDMWVDHRCVEEPTPPPVPSVVPLSDVYGRRPNGRSRLLACATAPK